jgi:hypothetical protein
VLLHQAVLPELLHLPLRLLQLVVRVVMNQ